MKWIFFEKSKIKILIKLWELFLIFRKEFTNNVLTVATEIPYRSATSL